MHSRTIASLLIALLTALPLAASLSPARAEKLACLETEDLQLVSLEPGLSYLVPHAARCFENSMSFQRKLFSYTPSERVTVLLSDFSDLGNATAATVPRDYLMVEAEPLSFTYETISSNERMNWIMNHELVHIATVDQAARSDRFFRALFRGKVAPTADDPESIFYFYLTAPRLAAPRWYSEGIAVFLETWMAGGLGRAQGAYDEMVFRSMVRDGSRFYDPLGLVSEGTKVDFQTEVNSYLYGTRFMSYLAYRYSPESLVRWVSRGARGEAGRSYYSSRFEEVYGTSLEKAWNDWVGWEHEFQKTNLEAIRKYPTTPYRDLSGRALGSVSRAFFDSDRKEIYAAFNYPGVVAHVGAISVEDGSVEKIVEVKDPVIYSVTSLAYDPAGKTIFYTTDNREHRDLRAVDPATKQSRTLLKDARIGDLAFDPADRSLWGVRHFNGICTLVRIPHPYAEWRQVHSWPYGQVVYDLDVSPDGRFLSASVGEIDGRHSLRVMSIDTLLGGDVTPVARVEFESTIPSDFVFSPDGKYLYGSSYRTGVSNIFRYDLATGALDAVSNCETGFFRPIPTGADSLIVFRYTGEGFVPAAIEARKLEDVSAITFLGERIADKDPIVKEWMVGSPAAIPLEAMTKRTGSYAPLKNVRIESLYPVVQGYKDSFAYGMRLNLSDPLSLHRARLTASYTPGDELPAGERLHLAAEWQRYDWRARYKRNAADFYDLFGPTKTSRKGWTAGGGWRKSLIYDKPRQLDLDLDADYHASLDSLPDYQNVSVTVDRLVSAKARLTFRNVRSSLGSVDDEKGHAWELVAGDDIVDGECLQQMCARGVKSFPKLRAGYDLGFALPLRHSSIWLRTSAGFSPRDREEPFANFFFGHFGNNWVDHGEVKRYRQSYSFPGVELNEIGGRNYGKAMVEWNLPPLRFSGLGRPGFYATWLRASLFSGGLVTNLDDGGSKRALGDVGTQVDLRFTLLSRLDMTLSFGYAVAFENGTGSRDEAMVSLKILE